DLIGSNEVLQAKVLLARVARAGKKTRQKFCQQVAKRAAKQGNHTWVRLELVRARFDPLEYFLTARQPVSQKRIARCNIQRATSSNHFGRSLRATGESR